jgi:hypothetical protein
VTEAGLHRKQYSATGSVSILAVRTIVEPVTIFGSGRVRNAAGASEMARIEVSRLKQYVAETERQQTSSLWQLQQSSAGFAQERSSQRPQTAEGVAWCNSACCGDMPCTLV